MALNRRVVPSFILQWSIFLNCTIVFNTLGILCKDSTVVSFPKRNMSSWQITDSEPKRNFPNA